MATAHTPTPAPKPAAPHHGPTMANPAANPKPAAAAKSPSTTQKPVILIVAAALVLLAAGVGVFLFVRGKTGTPAEPSLNEQTEVIAKFMATPAYHNLPFERQKVFMRVIEKREDKGELLKAYRAELINAAEYRNALGEAWLGKHLGRIEKYTDAQGIVAKNQVLDELIKSKEKDDDKPPKPGKNEDFILGDKGQKLPKVKKDKTAEEARLGQFPTEVQEEWKRYKKALKARERMHEQAEMEAARDGKPIPATRPATAPAVHK